MNMTLPEVRQRIAAAVAATSGDWHESRWTYDLFPSDAKSYLHQSFAVGVPSFAFDTAIENRRGDAGGRGTASVGVRFLYRVKGDKQVETYDLALAEVDAVRRAILSAPKTGCHVMVTETRHGIVGDGTWFQAEISVTVVCRVLV